jgi:hypothetical protein
LCTSFSLVFSLFAIPWQRKLSVSLCVFVHFTNNEGEVVADDERQSRFEGFKPKLLLACTKIFPGV